MTQHITQNTFLCLILGLITIPHAAHGMWHHNALGNIEKQIFLREVNRIGKEVASQKIQNTKEPKSITNECGCELQLYPCFILTTQLRPNSNDPLAQQVLETITEQEEKRGYIPNAITTNDQHGYHIVATNNSIENFTKYWHKEDRNGKYIELTSTFDHKQSLLDVLDNQ